MIHSNAIIASSILLEYRKHDFDIMIDVGINIFEYIHFSSMMFKLVIGFEPNRNFDQIGKKIVKYGLENGDINLYNYGISDHDHQGKFYECTVNSAYSGPDYAVIDTMVNEKHMFSESNWTEKTITYRKLDSLALVPYGHSLSFLKIDTEFNDTVVLNGAIDLIQTHRPLIQVEHIINEHGLRDDIVEFMSKYNYKIKQIEPQFRSDNFFLIPAEWDDK